VIDRELRTAGGVFGQPTIVQASKMAITFNRNLYTRSQSTDPSGTFLTTTLDTLATESFQTGLAAALPLVVKTYPTATYTDSNGTRSPAETISFFLRADATSGRSDIYSLYRRVNAKDSSFVTGNLWIPSDTGYFFRYYRMSASGAASLISPDSLPLYWDDASRTIDSIAVVEMRIAGWTYVARDNEDVFRTVYQRTQIANAGRLVAATCGDSPAAPTSVTATVTNNSGGSPVQVAVAWTGSTDDNAGDRDVRSYMVARRASAGTTWYPVGNAPARGGGSYSFTDYSLTPGTWVYGVKAMDCGPNWSSAGETASAVTIP
jgi:hypothetical protein